MVSRARVHGGIITDQMLTGSMRYFKITADFGYVISNNTVNLDSKVSGGDAPKTFYHVVPDGVSVPGSAGEAALQVILEKCTIVQIGVAGSPRASAIHIACENTACGWEDAAAIQTAIQEIGSITVPTTVGTENAELTPVTEDIDLSSATVTEVPFILA